jgi:hypothetical protein
LHRGLCPVFVEQVQNDAIGPAKALLEVIYLLKRFDVKILRANLNFVFSSRASTALLGLHGRVVLLEHGVGGDLALTRSECFPKTTLPPPT